ncbi:MAG TPA: hypothetical protein VJB02_03450 [Coxiellaceae bacterium]|nr:hypothetical protein [Coxiellaceae bacterium]
MTLLETLQQELTDLIENFRAEHYDADRKTDLLSSEVKKSIHILLAAVRSTPECLDLLVKIYQVLNHTLYYGWLTPFFWLSQGYKFRVYLIKIVRQGKYSLMDVLKTTYQEAKIRIQQLERENQRLRALAEYSQRRDITPAVTEEVDETLSVLHARITLQERQIKTMEEENDELAEAHQTVTTEKEALVAENARLKAELEACRETLLRLQPPRPTAS